MAYTTVDAMTVRYGERMLINLTDDRLEDRTGGIIEETIEAAITNADNLIDSHVVTRYVLPFDPVPSIVAEISQQIAIYKLHIHEPNPKIVAEYQEALVQLKEIQRGVMRLEAEGVSAPQTDAGGVTVTDRERPFTADSMKGFI